MDDSNSHTIPFLAFAPPALPPMPAVVAAENGNEHAAAAVANNERPAAPALPPPQPAPPPSPPPAQPPANAIAVSSQVTTAIKPLTKPLTPSISFDVIFSELQSWKQQNDGHGTLAIPMTHPALARIADALTAVNIEDVVVRRWDEQLAQLRAYKGLHGNCNAPPSHPTLGKWVAEQRECYKLHERRKPSALTPARFEQLRSLGLTVNRWEKRLEELRAFKAEHGHCDVPIDYPSLGVWVLNQRDAYHFEREEMAQDRIKALEGLGFNWNRWGRNRSKDREDAWDAQFTKLMEFIKVNGHSNLSQHDKANERLGKWIKNQRYEYRKYHTKGLGPSRLGRDRIDKLNEIGFQWRLRPERIPWDDRFKALVQFKEAHSHCRVPMSVPELGKWAKYQRDQYCLFMRGKKAKINQQKIDKLLSVGFDDSLDVRVALGLACEGEEDGPVDERDDGDGHHHHVAKDPNDHAPQEEMAETVVAYHHHGEHAAAAGHAMGEHHAAEQPYVAGQYHHGDPVHVYGSVPPQGPGGAFHYQHGGGHVHYA